MLGFGEMCHYKVSKSKKDKALEGKLGTKWRTGIFLGFSRDANEYVMCDVGGQDIVRARSLQRKPTRFRWNAAELMRLNLRPRDSLYRATAEPTGHREAEMSFEERLIPEHDQPQVRSKGVHDFSVLKRHLEEFGFTEVGCPRCDYMRTHGTGRGCAVAHSKHCRARIKRAMRETESGRIELKKFTDR